MKIIGITGGVGSGKSRVLSFLNKEYGAVICQADHVAWELQTPGNICYNMITDHFGVEVLNTDGTIDRRKLGKRVFSDNEELVVLNNIMHPAVKEKVLEIIKEEQKKHTEIFVLEAALLLEEHYDEICDEIWYIYTKEDVRRQRLRESRQYSEEKIDAIMNTQLSEEIFKQKCNVIIDNTGEFEDTCYQIENAMRGEVK